MIAEVRDQSTLIDRPQVLALERVLPPALDQSIHPVLVRVQDQSIHHVQVQALDRNIHLALVQVPGPLHHVLAPVLVQDQNMDLALAILLVRHRAAAIHRVISLLLERHRAAQEVLVQEAAAPSLAIQGLLLRSIEQLALVVSQVSRTTK